MNLKRRFKKRHRIRKRKVFGKFSDRWIVYHYSYIERVSRRVGMRRKAGEAIPPRIPPLDRVGRSTPFDLFIGRFKMRFERTPQFENPPVIGRMSRTLHDDTGQPHKGHRADVLPHRKET